MVKKNELQGDSIIVAPHPDDEIIGCSEILSKQKTIIIYNDADNTRKEELTKLRDLFQIKVQLFQKSIPPNLLHPNNIFYIPDPIYEIHPLHREMGAIGESMARQGLNVIFYSTIMNAPYIHEVKNPDKKEEALNQIYPSQKNLWKYEKKYVLFEGRCKWIF